MGAARSGRSRHQLARNQEQKVASRRITQEVRSISRSDDIDAGFVFATARGRSVTGLDRAMRNICKTIGCDRATPHDLRRTFGSRLTALGFGRQAMDRILNHADRGVGSVYDRHSYATEDRRIMEAISRHIAQIVSGREGDNVVRGKFYGGE